MKAHKLLENLEALVAHGQIAIVDADFLEAKIVESQKFEFDFGEFPVLSEEEMRHQIGDLRLPYQLCYFDVPLVGALLARDFDNVVVIQPFIRLPDGRIASPPLALNLLIEKSSGTVIFGSDDIELQSEYSDPEDWFMASIVGLASLVVRGICVLNCTNVDVVDNHGPVALNKKRAKSGKHCTSAQPSLKTPGLSPAQQSVMPRACTFVGVIFEGCLLAQRHGFNHAWLVAQPTAS